MKVLFAGSPAIAVPVFETLCREKEIEVTGVLTNPDTPKGRHGTAQPTEVGEAAAKALQEFEGQGLSFVIFKTLKLDAALGEQIAGLKPDLLVSFAYGRIFSPEFLALFPLGGINIHPSLLPKYRGPTPIQAAILNRDSETGITVQKLAKELDSGDILAQDKLQLTGMETTKTLSETVAQKAAQMLPELLKGIASGIARPTPQNHGEASFCYKVAKEDGFIDWKKSAAEIDAKVRAFDPWPLCRTIHKGRELLILKTAVYNGDQDVHGQPGLVLGTDKQGILVQTGEGILAVTELQYQAKKALNWRDFMNGARDFIGKEL